MKQAATISRTTAIAVKNLSKAQSLSKTGELDLGPFRVRGPLWLILLTVLAGAITAPAWLFRDELRSTVRARFAPAYEKQQFAEWEKHFSEDPEARQVLAGGDEEAVLEVAYYPSDSCLLVTRNGRSRWLTDNPAEAPGGPPREAWAPAEPEVALAGFGARPVAQSCPKNGKCLDKHPGKPTSRHGEKKGCWVKVWRSWPDGCRHFQWFNSCDGSWNSEIEWTCCIH